MAIHIYNVNTMLLGPESPEFLVHATAGEVHLDGSIVHNSRTLLVNITVAGASAKLLRHAIGDANTQTCLAELSFGISFEAILKAQGPLSVEVSYLLNNKNNFYFDKSRAKLKLVYHYICKRKV